MQDPYSYHNVNILHISDIAYSPYLECGDRIQLLIFIN